MTATQLVSLLYGAVQFVESVDVNLVGKRLRALRQEARLSQEDVANNANVSAKFISQIETANANPSIEILHALVEKGLNLSMAAFFAYDTMGNQTRDDIREIQALFSAQPKQQRKRALHILRALIEPLPKN